jgi:hypothetical protein
MDLSSLGGAEDSDWEVVWSDVELGARTVIARGGRLPTGQNQRGTSVGAHGERQRQGRLPEELGIWVAGIGVYGVQEESTAANASTRLGPPSRAVVGASSGCRVKGPWHWGQRVRSGPVPSRNRSSQVRSTGGSTPGSPRSWRQRAKRVETWRPASRP